MSTHGFVQRGRELLERGDFQEAVKVCRRGLLAHPAAVDGRLLLGRALMALRRYNEVIAEMGVVLDGDARHPQALLLKGEALLLKGDAGRAVQALKQAREVSPSDLSLDALLRRAEGLAGKAKLDFTDDEPVSGVTRHYPLNQLQRMAGKAGASALPPALPGRRRAGDTENESGSMEIYLEPGDVDLIDDLLDTSAGAGTAGGAPVAASAPVAAGGVDESAAARTRRMRPLEGGKAGSRDATADQAEEILDELVEEVSIPRSVTGVLDSLDVLEDPAAGDDAAGVEPPIASRNSSFDEPTVIYRSSEPRSGAPADPGALAPGNNASVATDHYPQLPASSRGGADAGAGGSPLAPSELPSDVLADLGGDLGDVDDDEPPTQMIPLDGSWQNAGESAGTEDAGNTLSYPQSLRPPNTGSVMRPVAGPAAGAEAPMAPYPAPVPPYPSLSAVQPQPGDLERGAGMAAGVPRPPDPGVLARTELVRAQAPPGRRRTLYYAIAALVVVAGGAITGLQIRKVRLGWEIAKVRTQAAEHARLDTYVGYVNARRAYLDILDVEDSLETRAALARLEAALVVELGTDLAAARQAVGAVERARQPDAAVARAYLALAEGDVVAARGSIEEMNALAPDDPFGAYLTGWASLLAGAGAEAVSAFGTALASGPRPLFHVGLGRAHLAGGALAEAEAAFREALALMPGYPAAVLGLAQVAMAGEGELPAQIPAALEGLIAEAARPLAEQSLGVSPAQAARAALALGTLRLLRDDADGAREAAARARAMVASDPGASLSIALELAQLLARLGESEGAMTEARRAVEAAPGRLGARVILARMALDMGDPELALDALEPGGEAVSRDAVALALRARARLARGDMEAAAADLDAALALQSDLPDAVIARAELDLRRGNARAAAERLAAMFGPDARPDAPADAGVVYAAALRQSGRLDEARKVIQELMAGPEAGRAYLELARLERKQGNIARAREAYASAAERLDGVDAGLEAALLAFDTGDRPGARTMLAELADRADTRGRVLVEAARIHAQTGALDVAARYLDRAEAIESVPRWQIARERGRLALRMRKPGAAIQALEQARALQERDPEVYLLLVEAHLDARDNEAAARVRDDVLARFEADAPVRHLVVGRLAATSPEPDQAIRAYRQARALLEKQGALPRELSHVDYLMARAYFYMDNLREAEAVLARVLQRDPAFADAYFVLGQVQYTREQLESAIASFQKAIDLEPASQAEALFYLGEVNYQMGRRKPAATSLRAYLAQAPEGEHAREAKAYLDELE